MKAETYFYIEIKHALQDLFGDRAHYQRIESGETVQGIPDINICVDGHELWLECKVYDNDFTALQRGWAKKRHSCGGRVYGIMKNHNQYSVCDFDVWFKHRDTIHEALKAILHDAFNYRWSE